MTEQDIRLGRLPSECTSGPCGPLPTAPSTDSNGAQPSITQARSVEGLISNAVSGGEAIATSINDASNTRSSAVVLAPTPGANPATNSVDSVAASSSKGGSNLSGGAVAGVAIAALIIGAALAFAAAFFFFKRRNDKNNNKARDGTVGYNTYADSTPELVMMQKSVGRNSPYVQVSQTPLPAPIVSPAPVPAQQSNSSDAIAGILPAAAHENEVQGRIAALFNQIHRHVETYYRDVHASITPSMEPELVRFGAKDVNMAELLQDCSNPTTALKHALVAYIIGITSPKKSDDDGETLFPEELNGARGQSANRSGKHHHHSSPLAKQLIQQAPAGPNLSTALTLHRRLSVFLYTSHATTRRSWSFQSDIREAAEHFSLTFFPWANPAADDQEKEDDLTRIISEALETRIWLFGQPSEFEFRWDGVGTRGVVVSPELVRQDGEDRSGRGKVVLESGVAGL